MRLGSYTPCAQGEIMSDESDGRTVTLDYPASTLPTTFADLIQNLSHSPEIAKFYLVRFDPPNGGLGDNRAQIVGQVAMPLSGLIQSVAFFNQAVENLIKSGVVKRETWDAALAAQREQVRFNG